MLKKYQENLIVLTILIITFFSRIQAIEYRIGLDWDEISLWYESLTEFRSPYMTPLPPLIFGWGMALFRSSSYFDFHLVSVIAGVLAVYVFFQVLRKFIGFSAAIIGGLFFAISPMGIFYSQEARHYSLVQLFASLLLWILLKISTSEYKKTTVYVNSFLIFIIVFFAFQTHLIFSNSVIALCITFFIHGLLHKDKFKINLTFLLSILFSSILANLWIIERQITEDLSKGFYTLGVFNFLNSVFTALGPRLSYVDLTKLSILSLQTSIFLFLALIGLMAVRKKNQSLFIFISVNFIFSLLILYLTLGEKSTWPWYRYLCPLLPSYILLVTFGFSELQAKLSSNLIKYSLVVLLIFLFNTKILIPANQQNSEVNAYIRLAHDELKSNEQILSGVLIPEANWGFGVESERNLSFYFNGKLTALPVFYVKKNAVMAINLEDSKWKLTRVAKLENIIDSKLKPGDYAIFPYGLIRQDGPFGINKPKCELLISYNLVAPEKIKRVITKTDYLPMIEICRILP